MTTVLRVIARLAWEVRCLLGMTEFDRHCAECHCDRWELCPTGRQLWDKRERREG